MVIHTAPSPTLPGGVSERGSSPGRQSEMSPGAGTQRLRSINNPAPLPALTAAPHRLIKHSVLLLQELGVMTYFFHARVPVNEQYNRNIWFKPSHFTVEIMQRPPR